MLNEEKTPDEGKAVVLIGNKQYQVLIDHKTGWKQEAFRERYSEVLDRYDYIVGDWGYNQLRLRGFFRDGNPKAVKDLQFSTVRDYLNEYCNFGCAYFILERLPGKGQVSAEDGISEEINDQAGKPDVPTRVHSHPPKKEGHAPPRKHSSRGHHLGQEKQEGAAPKQKGGHPSQSKGPATGQAGKKTDGHPHRSRGPKRHHSRGQAGEEAFAAHPSRRSHSKPDPIKP